MHLFSQFPTPLQIMQTCTLYVKTILEPGQLNGSTFYMQKIHQPNYGP